MFLFAITYLSLPVFLVLFTFFTHLYVLLSAVALVVLVFCLYSSRQREGSSGRNIVAYWPLLLVSLVVTFFCVVFPIKVWDWEKHYAVFNALVQNSWPPVVELNEQSYFLRYFPAWYVLPSLLAKIFGSQLLTISIFIWTSLAVFIVLFLAFSYLREIKHLFVAVLVFFFFSGLDLVGVCLNGYVPPFSTNWPNVWISWGEIWPGLTSLDWTPQHVLGGWIGACLFLYNRRLAVEYSAVIIVLVALWSAFPAIGLIPIALWALSKEGYKVAFTPQNLLAAPLIAIVIALYLLQGSGDVPLMFVWDHGGFSIYNFMLFCVLEFLLALAILYFLLRKERGLIATMACFLTGLCLVRFGVFNDLLMRGAIPSICIMSIFIFKALIQAHHFWREVVITYLFVGAIPVAIAFAYGISPSSGKIDKSIDFKKLTALYTYEKYPYMTFNYIAKTKDAISILHVPLMRGMP